MLLVLVHASGALRRIDATLYDAAQTLWARPANPDIVIVALDEDSLADIGRWPWVRGVHAAILGRLLEARAVGYDVIFAEPDRRDAAGDAALAGALAAQQRTVLPVMLEARAGAITEVGPLPSLATPAAGLGHIHLELDEDGIGRRVWLQEGLSGQVRPHFMVELAAVGGAPVTLPRQRVREGAAPPWVRDRHWLIPFAGKPGHYTRISAVALLRGDYPASFFRGKWVLVGATAAGLGDAYPTPVSGASGAMPGVELNANILDGLLRGIILREAPPAAVLVLALVLLLGTMAGFLWLPPRGGVALVSGVIVSLLLASWLLLQLARLWVPPALPLLALALAHPLWSWRRLEATQHYMEEELQRFTREPEWLPTQARPSAPGSRFVADVIGRRIDEVREATARLRRLRRLVADTLDSLPEAAMLVDRDGRIVLANPRAAEYCRAASAAAMAGTPLHPWLAGLQGSEHASLEDAVRRLLEQGSASTTEITDPAGRVFTAALAPCVSEAAGVTGAIVSLTDVTALRVEERQRRELMSFLTHDIRAPQAAIVTLLDATESGSRTMTEREVFTRIRQYAARALTLSDDLFKFLQAERIDPARFVDVDMVDVLGEAADEYWQKASSKGIVIDLQLPDDAVYIFGNRGLLVRAVGNLLDNAVKYSPGGTHVTVSVERQGNVCRLEVVDQGYGIPEQSLGLIFQRSVRFHAESHPEIAGSGLGLAFVKLVAEKHGGRVEVQTRWGQGTRFVLVLPAV